MTIAAARPLVPAPARHAAWPPSRRLGAALLLAAAVLGLWLAPRTFHATWLGAWWFCLGIALGSGANARIHALSGGRWGEALGAPHRAIAARLPWLLVAFLPLLAGLQALYPWLGDRSAWRAVMDQPAFADAWFSPAFVALRWLGYAALAWRGSRDLARPVAGPAPSIGPGRAALGLGLYMVVGSLAAIDLLESLLAGWNSTVFGWLALIGQMGAGAAVSVALAARAAPLLPAAETAPTRELPPVWRDLGNLLLMYVLLQAYLHFMQFLIIWAENLPREIRWYLPRVRGGWAAVSLALVAAQFAVPLLLLLWRRNKDDPRRLARIAIGCAAAQGLGSVWLVVPSVAPADGAAWWLVPMVGVGLYAAVYGGIGDEVRAASAALAGNRADPTADEAGRDGPGAAP